MNFMEKSPRNSPQILYDSGANASITEMMIDLFFFCFQDSFDEGYDALIVASEGFLC